MITFNKLNKSEPYKRFVDLYNQALSMNQESIEVAAISSFCNTSNEVESRYVNLKYIEDDEWIFFSNYNSKKANNFESHDQISVLFYWATANIQIRIKAKIKKTSSGFSDKHFLERSDEKNALAISSNQSDTINSYDEVINNYQSILNDKSKLLQRPGYWGGYSFTPYYFEFWTGHQSRLNKREVFHKSNESWTFSIIQP